MSLLSLAQHASHVDKFSFKKRLGILLEISLDFSPICIIEDRLLQNLVTESGLAECRNNALFDLLLVVDELELTKALESTLFNQFFACTVPNAKSVQPLVQITLLRNKINQSLGVPNRSIGQQKDVRSLALARSFMLKDLCKRLIDFCASKICCELRYPVYSDLHHLICVVNTPLREHELKARAIAANIEFTTRRQTVQE